MTDSTKDSDGCADAGEVVTTPTYYNGGSNGHVQGGDAAEAIFPAGVDEGVNLLINVEDYPIQLTSWSKVLKEQCNLKTMMR